METIRSVVAKIWNEADSHAVNGDRFWSPATIYFRLYANKAQSWHAGRQRAFTYKENFLTKSIQLQDANFSLPDAGQQAISSNTFGASGSS